MARRFPLRAGFTALLAATAMTLGCLAAMPASASASVAVRVPAWHVVYRQANLDISGVTAGGPDDAWAYGTGKLGGGKLLHWNGISWAPAGYPHQNTYDIRAAFVLSPTDVWFAGNNEAPPLTAEILHWQNGSWSWLQIPSQTNGANVDVLADNDIWSFGGQLASCDSGTNLDGQGCTPTSHWNGSVWHTYPLHAVQAGGFFSSSRTDVWAAGNSYIRPGRHGSTPTSVEYAFRWNGSAWQRATVAGVRTGWTSSLVVDSPVNVWLAEASHAAPKACAMHWNGKTWRPLYLPGRRTCLGAVTDYRTGFWTGVGPNFNGRFIVGFAFLHWNGKRYRIVPGFVPNKIGWDTNGFVITAVPRSSRVWVYGSWCPVSRECHGQGVIATLR